MMDKDSEAWSSSTVSAINQLCHLEKSHFLSVGGPQFPCLSKGMTVDLTNNPSRDC